MSTIVKLGIPSVEFALHETLEAMPTVTFEIARVVAHETDRVMPFVWATDEGNDRETLNGTLADDPSVENVVEFAAFESEWFYRMEWVTDVEVVLHILLEQQGTILNADGRNDKWHLRLLFPDRKSLSATYDFCTENELTVTVESIYDLDGEHCDRYGLTEAQHETLVTAVERGYFDIPQKITMDDLAADFGVSHQALSERLHRGHKTLIENALLVGRMDE